MTNVRTQDLRLLEALLFAAKEPLSLKDLQSYFRSETDVLALLSALAADYMGRGIEVVERGGCWALRTASDLAADLARVREEPRPLTRAAMETLAVIAYHQPITRAEIEAIRGVSTQRRALSPLIEANWIRPGRRRDTPGKPTTWVTTPTFLDHFSLSSLEDLPGIHDMRACGLLATPSMDLFASPLVVSAQEEEEN